MDLVVLFTQNNWGKIARKRTMRDCFLLKRFTTTLAGLQHQVSQRNPVSWLYLKMGSYLNSVCNLHVMLILYKFKQM